MESKRYYAVVPSVGDEPDIFFEKSDAEEEWHVDKCHWHGWISVIIENE